ncbi:MAG: hypothetical protein ACOCVF_00155 [bacterium]
MGKNVIHEILKPFDGYLKKIERDTIKGVYTLTIGLPTNWVISETDEIGFKIIKETDVGKIVEVYPKKDDLVEDKLFEYCKVVFTNNKKIAEKEEEFIKKMEKFKSSLEEESKKFYEELQQMKEQAFKPDLDININTDPTISLDKPTTTKGKRRGRTAKSKVENAEKVKKQ